MKAAAEAHPDKQVALWFMDEARVGQKGRTTHRWWVRGERPLGLAEALRVGLHLRRRATRNRRRLRPRPSTRLGKGHEHVPRRVRQDRP